MKLSNRKIIFSGIFLLIFINEFSPLLQFFDKNPPLGPEANLLIRIFDILILFIVLISINNGYLLRFIPRFITIYIMPSIIVLFLFDITLRWVGNFGHDRHFDQDNLLRFPHPSDTFRGKPDVLDHNEFGFRGNFVSSDDKYNVAIFSGSTGYNGNPPIIQIVREILSEQGININTFNFSSVSSNHSQHVHRLLDFSDRIDFDLVIFYGGGNEALLPTIYDPRPGYPYNFYFRNELSASVQSLLRYSSILGTIDLKTGGVISGLRAIQKSTIIPGWSDSVIENYWRNLALANNITTQILQPNYCKRSNFISILQPGNPITELQSEVWSKLLQSSKFFNRKWKHIDLSMMSDTLEFTDFIHITQDSRKIMAHKISKEVKKTLLDNCS